MRRSHFIALILAALTLLTFGALTNQFVTFDDEPLIYANPHFHPADLAGLVWHWTHPHWNLYVPVVYTAWWLIAQVGGADDPTFFHAANLLVHFGSAWMCFLILRALVTSELASAAGAILFLVHPLQAEPVAWATGMKDVLCGFLSLATILTYIHFVRSRRKSSYFAATALFILSLLAKPSAVTVPLICAVIEISILKGSWRRCILWLGPWLIPAGVIAFVSAIVQSSQPVDGGPIWARPLIADDALGFYLYKLFWPINLGIDYGRTPSSVIHLHSFLWLVPPIVGPLIAYNIRNRTLAAAAAIFALALLPVLGFKPFLFQIHSTVADRYVYLAMLGPALALATLMARYGKTAYISLAILLVLLGIQSFIQTGYWHDSEALYEHGIVVNPTSVEAHNNLGVIFADRGDVPGAVAEYRIAINLQPDYLPAYRYIADAEAAMGNWLAAEKDSEQAIEVAKPDDLESLHRWRAGIFLKCGEAWNDKSAYEKAIDECRKALRLDPNDAETRKILAEAQTRLAQ